MNINIEQFRKLALEIEKRKKQKQIYLKKNGFSSGDLSSAQKRMFFLTKLLPDNSLYNVPLAIHIESDFVFDVSLLESSLNHIINQHEILRTVFDSKNLKQIILDEQFVKVQYIDLINEKDNYEIARKFIVSENKKEFDLEMGPLLRFSVLHLSEKKYIFVIIIHHLISDGWSNNLIFKEIAQVYASLVQNSKIVFKEHLFQYLDYVEWEKENLKNENITKQMDYWKNKLKGDLHSPDIIPDFTSNNKISYSGKIETMILDCQFVNMLKEISQEQKITLFELLLSTFFFLIHIYTNQNDIIIGTTTVNRKLEQFQEMFGLFTNTALYRGEFDGNDLIEKIIKKIAQINREALNHQDLPFDLLIKELNPIRLVDETPLISVFFAYQNFPKMFDYEGIKASPFKVDYGTSRFDIDMTIEEVKDELFVTINYRSDLFHENTIKSMLSYYKKILHQLKNSIYIPLKNLTIDHHIDDKSIKKEVFIDFVSRFEKQAREIPDEIAVEFENNFLTYRDLNSKANQFARYLQKYITNKSEPIALLMDHDVWAIIAILSIMKCRACYTPIDKTTPEKRIYDILDNAQIKIVITDHLNINGMININPKNCVDNFIENEKVNLNEKNSQDDLAYIIYTSGSTGTPKGVCVEHAQLSSYIDSIWDCSDLSNNESFAVFTSFSTDMGHTMIFPPLAYGKKVVIIPSNVMSDLDKLFSIFQNNSIDCLKLTPSHMSILLSYKNIESILPKKKLIFAGEPLKWELIKKVRKFFKGEIFNYYGPTETTVTALIYKVPEYKNNEIYVPIGYPLSNTKIYITKDLIPVPKGIVGELFISGNGVSRGYLDNKNLNNERFIFLNMQKTYRTGDLVRYRYDNSIEFIGRNDRQIKSFGHRIELGDIEANLLSIAGIQNAIAINSANGIIAYIVQNNNLTSSEIMNLLSKKLPHHMLPQKTVLLDKIPQTIGGKIDYKSLPMIEIKDREDISPRYQTELLVMQIWEEILDCSRISIKDNFFDLGGHSIHALKLIKKLEETFNNKFHLSIVFENNTIEKLAAFISNTTQTPNETSIIEIKHSKEPTVQFFFVHPAGGSAFCYYELARELPENYQFFAIQSNYIYNDDVSYESIESMATLYFDQIIEEINENCLIVFGGWSMGGLIAFEMNELFIKKHPNINSSLIIIDNIISDKKENKAKNKNFILGFIRKIETISGIKFCEDDWNKKTHLEQIKIALEFFKTAHIIPDNLSEVDFEKFLNIYEKHVIASEKYQLRESKLENVFIIKAKEQFQEITDEYLGWGNFFRNKPLTTIVPGNHLTMMTKNNIKNISNEVEIWIKQISKI